MTVDQIRYFLVLSDTLNYTEAAERLYISQSSLSRQIQALETEIGVRLVNRSRQGASLTEAGVVFKKEFGRILKEMDSSLEKVRGAECPDRAIRLSLLQSLHHSEAVAKLIMRLEHKLPDASISLHLEKAEELRETMLSHGADLYIVTDDIPMNFDHLASTEIGKLENALIYPANQFGERSPELKDFSGMTFITFEEKVAPGSRARSEKWLTKQGIIPEKILETSDLMNTLVYLDKSPRFGIVTRALADEYRNEVGILPITDDDMKPNIVVLWDKENERSIRALWSE